MAQLQPGAADASCFIPFDGLCVPDPASAGASPHALQSEQKDTARMLGSGSSSSGAAPAQSQSQSQSQSSSQTRAKERLGDKKPVWPAQRESTPPLVHRATLGLTDVYRKCSDDFRYVKSLNPRRALTKDCAPARNHGFDNADNDLILIANDDLVSDSGVAYRVVDLLGQGSFGQVAKCQVRLLANHLPGEAELLDAPGRLVAVKVIKNKLAYHNQALVETHILRLLNSAEDDFEDGVCAGAGDAGAAGDDDGDEGGDGGDGAADGARSRRARARAWSDASAASAPGESPVQTRQRLLRERRHMRRARSLAGGSTGSSSHNNNPSNNGSVSGGVMVTAGARRIVELFDCFEFRSHLCLVFSMLSIDLYELIKRNKFRGLPMPFIRSCLAQITEALLVLADADIVHCDLKPENILLVDGASATTPSGASPRVQLIDFGSSCFRDQTVYTYIQSRFYRAPEVLVGLPYGLAIDMWSLGCVAAELYMGLPVFPGVSEHNQLARISETLGPVPDAVLSDARATAKFYRRRRDGDAIAGGSSGGGGDAAGAGARAQWELKSARRWAQEQGLPRPEQTKRYVPHVTLEDMVHKGTNRVAPPTTFPAGAQQPRSQPHSQPQQQVAQPPAQAESPPLVRKRSMEAVEEEGYETREAFLDLLRGLLRVDARRRWTAWQTKDHPFLLGERFSAPHIPGPDPGPGARRRPPSRRRQRRTLSSSQQSQQPPSAQQPQQPQSVQPQLASQQSQQLQQPQQPQATRQPRLSTTSSADSEDPAMDEDDVLDELPGMLSPPQASFARRQQPAASSQYHPQQQQQQRLRRPPPLQPATSAPQVFGAGYDRRWLLGPDDVGPAPLDTPRGSLLSSHSGSAEPRSLESSASSQPLWFGGPPAAPLTPQQASQLQLQQLQHMQLTSPAHTATHGRSFSFQGPFGGGDAAAQLSHAQFAPPPLPQQPLSVQTQHHRRPSTSSVTSTASSVASPLSRPQHPYPFGHQFSWDGAIAAGAASFIPDAYSGPASASGSGGFFFSPAGAVGSGGNGNGSGGGAGASGAGYGAAAYPPAPSMLPPPPQFGRGGWQHQTQPMHSYAAYAAAPSQQQQQQQQQHEFLQAFPQPMQQQRPAQTPGAAQQSQQQLQQSAKPAQQQRQRRRKSGTEPQSPTGEDEATLFKLSPGLEPRPSP